jgi:HTH-type transcriptional regulator/antitoxin HipB
MPQPFQNNNSTWVDVTELKTIGVRLRAKRKQMRLTQSEAAGLCNVGVRFISELENGKSTMQFDKVLKVLKRFGFAFGMREKR